MSNEPYFTKTQKWVAALAGLGLVASLIFAYWGWGQSIKCGSGIKIAQALVVAFWTIAPPIWFWCEYFFIVRAGLSQSGSVSVVSTFEQFKYGQDVSAKLWIAAVSTLLMLYFWRDIGRE